MVRWGMVIDLDKCTACQACVVACKAENNVPIGGAEEQRSGRQIAWMDIVVKKLEEGEAYLPRPCMHCDHPPCVAVCPVGATYKREDGIVDQDYKMYRMQALHGCLPIRCQVLQLACPRMA